jgi:hypothetical protein
MPVLPIEVPRSSTQAARFGLLDVFTPQAMDPKGAFAGVTYEAEFCGIARPWVRPCVDPGVGVEKDPDDGIPFVSGEPIPIYHLHTCRLVGSGSEADQVSRARRALELGASRAVEEGFGAVLNADPDLENVTSGTAVGAVEALALLEQEGGVSYGGQRVIHMDNALATILFAANAIVERNGRLETGLGSIVVAGPGYANSTEAVAPAANSRWMYATGAVNVWADPGTYSPVTLNIGAGGSYDNEYKTLAERIYVPTYECFVAGAETLLEA